MRETRSQQLNKVFRHLVNAPLRNAASHSSTAADQFEPQEHTPAVGLRKVNAAFLIALCGHEHPQYADAGRFLQQALDDSSLHTVADFYLQGLRVIPAEIETAYERDEDFRRRFDNLQAWFDDPRFQAQSSETTEAIRAVFFPEGDEIIAFRKKKQEELRRKRTVRITALNPSPVQDPFSELLLTANVLLTVPSAAQPLQEHALSKPLRKTLAAVVREDQRYWFDHPVQIGVPAANNEIIYGLRGLEQALAFEKQRGTGRKEQTITCVLSVSVTHDGLHAIAQRYVQEALQEIGPFTSLRVHVFTERETNRLIDEVLAPAADAYLNEPDARDLLREVIGVDGEYGRHYSFLKAIAAFWQVLINPSIRATFKIDLDQVFPQTELVAETGASALEHFRTPLWGAREIDSRGRPVELGMIAGALVNEKDIGTGLFTPHVPFPSNPTGAEELIFYSTLPQALSTEAEMMTRYDSSTLDGLHACIQRIHVTGGTCGILVDSLRRHRPFTPSFIGRAEDQAYILSVLFKDRELLLRYVHQPGLIMRHDKEAFAGEAIKTAYSGKLVGDYARILWFSAYARALPWPLQETKDLVDPFTGCFISKIPVTITYLRMALKAAALFTGNGDQVKASELLYIGTKRLSSIMHYLTARPDPLEKRLQREKKAWDLYYDSMNALEEALARRDPYAVDLQNKAEKLAKDTLLKI